jgi:Methyltransferase domain/Tetratricopeptide repeat
MTSGARTISADEAYRAALERYAAGDLQQAEALSRAVLSAEPGHPAGGLLAALLIENGRVDEGRTLLRALAKAPAHTITIDYPVPQTPRHGERPEPRLNALLSSRADEFVATLHSLCALSECLQRIPASPAPTTPGWVNPWLPALDAIALYGFIAARKPRRYLEIGSGHSTRFARRAIEDHHLDCEVISIDPHPRAEIDALCDAVIRQPLEAIDFAIFEELNERDVVFLDSSHRCFMGSDVAVFFGELLPGLKKGVLLGIHDIFLPFDYPHAWVARYYSEQYLLACYLLARAPFLDVALPVHYLTRGADIREARALCAALPGAPEPDGASFWLDIV